MKSIILHSICIILSVAGIVMNFTTKEDFENKEQTQKIQQINKMLIELEQKKQQYDSIKKSLDGLTRKQLDSVIFTDYTNKGATHLCRSKNN